jgi:hypothetical protein
VSRLLWTVLALALASCALQSWRLASERQAHAETREGFAAAAAAAESAARVEEQRRLAALQEVIDDTEKNLERARADAAAARDAGHRLRERFAAVAGGCAGAADSGAAGAGEAAGSSGDLLALVQRRVDEAAGELARFADAARAAGLACEQSWRALDLE